MKKPVKIMGLDIGDKTIGVATSDLMGWTAQGLEVIRRSSKQKDISCLLAIVEKHQIKQLVVGLPKNMNGTSGPQVKKVQKFSQEIAAVLKLPLAFWDERLTTVAAEKMLLEADVSRKKRKKVIDKIAATFILQGYLDSKSQQLQKAKP